MGWEIVCEKERWEKEGWRKREREGAKLKMRWKQGLVLWL